MTKNNQLIFVSTAKQEMSCYKNDRLEYSYSVSTGKNGVGEVINSECTPRGWHQVFSLIGSALPINSVFVQRKWSGEIYNKELAQAYPNRDWILTRIIQLDGLEEGRNKGGEVDSLRRYIYIHGTPDTNPMGEPLSHGCIRLRNNDIIELMNWIDLKTLVCIE